ncbi:GGDEF domain-containing protein [Aquisalimonas sp.]|uniref:GGDEF domain-containing protein n=1 Tax=Aquisalimonas sp. TaxID=1872621 RepID=UPI0025BC9934|nr:GGDEF domain-containing protein [Aquisalimonas sp.]
MPDKQRPLDPQRLLVLRALLVFTVFGCLFFAILNLSRGVYPLAAIELVIAGFSAWLYYWIERTPVPQRWLMIYLVLFFGTIMVAIGTPSGTATIFVWVFLIPLIAHLLLGRARGLAVSVVFLALAATLYFYRMHGHSELMEVIAIANVVICAFVITGLSYAYEAGREQTERRLQELASTDALTGLPNRGALEPILRHKQAEALRDASEFAVLSMDLDYFKAINDDYGHQVGDRTLVVFAELLRQRLRASDVPCRWGGEEFQVLLSGTGRAGAARIAEDIRNALATTEITAEDHCFRMTISVGVAVYPEDASDTPELLLVADRRLYQAKTQGRNRVVDGSADGQARYVRMGEPPGVDAQRSRKKTLRAH